MGEEELGMNLFLGDDDLFNEDPIEDPIDNPPAGNENDDIEDQDEPGIPHNEEPDEDDDPERVVGDDTEGSEDTDVNSSPPLFKSFASLLHQEGVLSSVDSSKLEEVKDIQDLANLIAEEVKAKELIDLTEEQREAVEAFRAGFTPELFRQHKQAELELNNIAEEDIISNEDLRRELIFQDFLNQGFNEDKALKLANRSFDTDNDVEDAKEALDNIKRGIAERFEEQKKYNLEQQKLAKEKEEKRIKDLESKILKTEDFTQGIKLTENHRKEVLKTMMTPVSKNPMTGAEENALMKDQRENEDFSQRLYTVYTLTKGFTDFSFFASKEVKKTINDFERVLKSNQHMLSGGNSNYLDDLDANDFDIGDKLVV